ncbi:MAG: lipid-A-disaccharide synthase [Acidobacteria bacterium]|jgi:lipid-A-disaccharide synthase|nr:MAG: lipid-A-disaccharide synthase [Acidobacteriota bacterium]GIU81344.1 MAG: lipid-A-disaccharide synthase [Pyrinomonadaceae bacterium]
MKYRLMIVVGEDSGDAHAARLVERLKELGDFEFFGVAGQKLRQSGVEAVVQADNLSVVGLPEIARSLPMFWKVFRKLKNEATARKPDAVILVDFPEFNLKLAKALKKRGLKIIYYISPQIWAWRKYRLSIIKNNVDLLLSILPFEKAWYEAHGFSKVEYVGNPLVRDVVPKMTKEEFCLRHGLNSTTPIVALLGGSRHKEIVRILPVLFETAEIMSRKNAEIQFVNALAPTRTEAEVEEAKEKVLRKFGSLKAKVITVHDKTYDALNAADVAAVTSGTATLETALIGTPLVVVYKTSWINYKLLRPLIDVPHFGLVNLIAKERVATELIQDEFTPENLANELFRLLDKKENQRMRARLRQIADSLGHGGASKRAAKVILEFLNQGESNQPKS